MTAFEQIAAVLRKEFRSELRTKSGLLTAGMFSVVAVVAISFAGQGRDLSGALASGLIWVALLFAAVVALPRTFISEEEQGTGDLLRLVCRPFAVFWGKSLFNGLLMAVTGLALATLYVGMAGLSVQNPTAFVLSLLGGCGALSGTVTLCGALVSQAAQRSILGGAIALPLLLPLIFLGVEATKFSLGEGNPATSWTAIGGLWLYAIASYALGPVLFESVWKS